MQHDKSENPDWWEPLSKIDTGYGFPIDQENSSVKFIESILKKIAIWDDLPTINPSETAAHIEQKYRDRIPKEVTRPKDLAEFLWSMTGSYFLEPSEDGSYVVDLSDYEKYEVREGFERYGGKVYLDGGQIIRYEYLGKTYSGDDEFARKIIQASLCLKMMVELHALRIHLGTSQRKTFEYREKWGQDSSWAPFLYLSTYGTLDVNRRIPILVGDYGLVVRLFALTQESYRQLVEDVLAKPAFSEDEYLGTDMTPWNQQIQEYQYKVEKFIRKIAPDSKGKDKDQSKRKEEEKENIQDKGRKGKGKENSQSKERKRKEKRKEKEIREFTDFFVAVTALHNQFGDAQVYSMAVSDFFLPKIYIDRPGYISRLDRDLLSTLLVSVTPRYPLIVDQSLEKIFSDPEHKKAWIKFSSEVTKVTSTWFDPNYFETSVGF